MCPHHEQRCDGPEGGGDRCVAGKPEDRERASRPREELCCRACFFITILSAELITEALGVTCSVPGRERGTPETW